MNMRIFTVVLLLLLLCPSIVPAQVIVTYAGTGSSGYTGDGGPATNAQVSTPSGVATDRIGNVYFVDQNANCVRKVDTAGIITTLAGTGISGYTGDGGPATAAQLYWPEGLTLNANGDIYIADQFNNVIRKIIASSGNIITIAGNNTIGYTGDGGPATAASLWHPGDVGADMYGNIFFADQDNSAVRKVDVTGVITTIAGVGVSGYSGDGGPAAAAKLNFPQGVAVDSAGNVFIADFYNSRIRRVDAGTGIITTVAGNGIGGFSGDGGPATAASIYDASAVAIDDTGNIYISDYYNSRIRKVNAATNIITTVAGDGTAAYCCDCHIATAAEIYHPAGIAVDTRGNIYIADFGNARLRQVTDSFYCPSLTVRSQSVDKIVNIYPTLSDGVYHLNVQGYKSVIIGVYDAVGNCVLKQNPVSSGFLVDLTDQPNGIYIVHAITDGEPVTFKLLKK